MTGPDIFFCTGFHCPSLQFISLNSAYPLPGFYAQNFAKVSVQQFLWVYANIFLTDFVALCSQFVGSIWSWFHFTASSVEGIHFSHVPSSTLMLHQCIVAPLMQKSLSFDLDMGLYLHFGSPCDDMQDLVTILDLRHLLLHHLCFAHINKPSGNHYFLLFSFTFLILILLCFIYIREFQTEDFTPC